MKLKFPMALIGLMTIFASIPANAQEQFARISIPESEQVKEIELKNRYYVKNQNFEHSSQEEHKYMSKKYGPLELNFRVNPLNTNRNGLAFNLDLMESYRILNQSHNFNEISQEFKADKKYQIINPEIKSRLSGVFGQTLSSFHFPWKKTNLAQASPQD